MFKKALPTACVLKPCCLAASIKMCEVLSKAPSISKKAHNFFSTVSFICAIIRDRAVSVDFLVGKQIGIKVEDAPQRSGP